MIDEARFVNATTRTILAEDYNGFLIMHSDKEYIVCSNRPVRVKGILSLHVTERLNSDVSFEKVLEFIDHKNRLFG